MTEHPARSTVGPDDTFHRADLIELAPVLRRTVELDPAGLARVQHRGANVRLLVRLPFGVLVARTIAASHVDAPRPENPVDRDVTYDATSLLAWIDDPAAPRPIRRDAQWRTASPPTAGWRRVESVPDSVVRDLVRAGALTLKQAADREGIAAGQPRAEVADTLLDSIVLTVTTDDHAGPTLTAEVNLRALSALTRMGFVARDSHVAVDIAGRWTRVAAAYGSVFLERAGAGLGVLRP